MEDNILILNIMSMEMNNVAASIAEISGPSSFTENGAPTYAIGDIPDAPLQLFLSATRGIEAENLDRHCQASFEADQLITLRLLAYIRDIRESGKGEREVFRKAMTFMAKTHPREILHNLQEYQGFGRCDDFQDVCLRLMREYLDKKLSEAEAANVMTFYNGVVRNISTQLSRDLLASRSTNREVSLMAKWVDRERQAPIFLATLAHQMGYLKMAKANVKAILGTDHSGGFASPWELFLFLTEHLHMPMTNKPMKKKGENKKVYRKLQTTMEQQMKDIQEAHKKLMSGINYALQKMRTDVLSPLNAHLNTIEVKLASKTPLTIKDIETMPGGALSKYKDKAMPKQAVWSQVLELLLKGSMKVKGISVDLVSIMKKYRKAKSEDPVTEMQLTAILENLLKNLATRMDSEDIEFSPACFVSDVSGSMEGISNGVAPIDVCCGLTIMSSLANIMSVWPKLKDSYTIEQMTQIALGKLPMPSGMEKPFYYRRCITFSERPNFFALQGSTWHQMIESFNSQPCGYSTNFLMVFENLVRAEKEKLVSTEFLPTRVVAITDAQFDSNFCGGTPRSTHHQIVALYERELGHAPPELIYWNVASNPRFNTCETANPDEEGVSMMTGFSQNMVKHVLMDEKQEEDSSNAEKKEKSSLTPKALLLRVVNDPVYAKITLPQ
jgi:hypothetical protein